MCKFKSQIKSQLGYLEFMLDLAFVIWHQGRTIKKSSKNLNQEWRYVADLLNRNDIELDDFDLMALPHITKSKIK